MDAKEYSLHVLVFPWLAHGRVPPFLELAKKLSQYNFYIYFCSTPIILSSIKDQISTLPSIQLVEIHLSCLPNLPPHYHTTKSLPPHLWSTLKEAFDMAQPSFSNLLTSLKPDLLIYDYFQPWAPEIASQHNIPSILSLTTSAAAISYFCHMWKAPNVDYPFPNIYYQDYDYQKMSQFLQSYNSNSNLNGNGFIEGIAKSSGVILIKTFKELEAKYIEQLSHILGGMEILPIGSVLVQEEPITTDTNNEGKQWEYLMSWLDKKDECSTVFVSFGSEYFTPREEIEEIAHGLELSGVSFIWVIRFHEGEKTEMEQVLPQGFLNRVGERGLVVEGWAPQVKILQHSSIGGFISHCGWSSVMEGIGVGVEVKRINEGKMARVEMAKVIKEVVVEKGGEEVKKKMKEISEKMRGDGEMELVVVEEMMKLCKKSYHQI